VRLFNAGDESYGVNHADDGGIDRGVRATDGGHRGKTFGHKQDTFADASVNGVQRQHGNAAIAAIEFERLNNEDFAALVRRHLLRGNYVSDNTSD